MNNSSIETPVLDDTRLYHIDDYKYSETAFAVELERLSSL